MAQDDCSNDYLGRTDGNGRALVLLHGAGGGKELWTKVQVVLEERGVPVLSLDLPGHGSSPVPPAADVEELANGVASRLRELGVSRAVVAGHSLGGAVALTIAAEALFPLEAVGVVSSGGRLPVSDALLEGIKNDFEAMSAKISRAAFRRGADPDLIAGMGAMMRDAGPALLHADFSACAAYGLAERKAGAIPCPVGIVCGEADILSPPSLSEELLGQLSDGTLTMIANAGHMPLLETPEATAAALLRLWSAVSRPQI